MLNQSSLVFHLFHHSDFLLCLEILGSGVGLYNLIKGLYTMYSDTESMRKQYKEYQEYLDAQQQGSIDLLTESQYTRFENGFAIV